MISAVFLAVLALSSSFVSAAPVPAVNSTEGALATINAAMSLPNTTQTSNITWMYQNDTAGACGLMSKDTDLVVGLPLEFYNATGSVSAYCGTFVVITNAANNETVTSRVSDASSANGTLSLSVATWAALNGTLTGLRTANWTFANATQTEAAKAALNSTASSTTLTPSPAASPAAEVAPSPAYVAPTPAYVAPTTPAYVAPTTPAYVAPVVAAASVYVAPYVAPTPAYVEPKATPAASSSSSSSSSTYSGTGTFYYQNGVAGACGKVNSDSAMIVAIDQRMYDGGKNCGRQVKIWNASGASVYATVADMCPTCVSSGSLDLSTGAFAGLAQQSAGIVGITWQFV